MKRRAPQIPPRGGRRVPGPAKGPAPSTRGRADEAIERLSSGDYRGAQAIAQSVLATSPEDATALEALGIACLQQGRPADALEPLRAVVRLRPGSPHAVSNLGAVLAGLKRHDEVLALTEAALARGLVAAPVHTARGVALQALGRRDEALEAYRAAIAIDPRSGDAANNLGTLLSAMDRHAEALDAFDKALAVKPAFAEALNNRGVSLAALGREDEAIAAYRAAATQRPDYLDPRKNLAELLARLGRNEEALLAYDDALRLAPNIAELVSNRSTVLNALNRHADALGGYDRALALKPGYVDALNNRGITLTALGRHEDALACFREAIEREPGHVNAHWNESLTLLRLGRFAEGWAKHEWRWKKPEFAPHKLELPMPRWTGREDLAGKSILLLSEQGYGDTLQFVRYVRLLEARGARVQLFVPEPVVALLRASFPQALVFNRTDRFPPADYHCPLISLPLAFGTLLETVPARTPYLAPPGDRLDAWARRVGPPGSPRVGVVWSGSASHRNDINRSIRLEDFAALLDVPGVRYYSLQKDVREGERAMLARLGHLVPLADEFRDFADTAAAIAALDLVITVDTSVAHLAAALGKPTWILLASISDWRWLPGREASPWYPTARLYWQPGIDQWAPAIARARADLAAFRPPAADPAPVPAAPPPIGIQQAMQKAVEFLKAGNLPDAEAISQGVLQLRDDDPDALQLIGSIRLQQGNAAAAVEFFQRVARARPRDSGALSNLAGALRHAQRHAEALDWYDRAIALAPSVANLHTNRGVALLSLQRNEEAAAAFDRALQIDEGNLAALNNRGVALNEMKRPEEALESFDRALRLKPDYTDALNNRGLSLISLNRLDEAEANYRRALEVRERYADALNNLGLALAGMARNAEAIDCFRKAQAYKPGYVDAHWNESLIDLVEGDFANGWRLYEWRWKKPEFAPHRRLFHVPQWTGAEPLEGRTIYIHAEQGFGDTLQFIRYVDLLHARGARVVASAPEPLRELLRASYPDVPIYCGSEVLPPFDLHTPMLSLPLCFGTDLASIPSRRGYLRAPAERVERWRARLGPRARPRVGIVWAGNPQHGNDRNRSIPSSAIGGLLADGIDWFALQRDLRDGDQAALAGKPIRMLAAEFADFADTAAAIECLDLVVSVDTSVAHLAGGMGKPVWVLLPFAPDWRWLMHREDSPWYPSARLLRQPALGAVDAQLARLKDDLHRWTKGEG